MHTRKWGKIWENSKVRVSLFFTIPKFEFHNFSPEIKIGHMEMTSKQ
jgi:hypothetical protein